MTQHTLPEDYNQWPRNHYHLLGVSYGCDEREIRRAYIQLIRKFKPDIFPEHFQRIRAAYEWVYAESKRHSPADEKKRPNPQTHVGDTKATPKLDDMVSPNLPHQQRSASSTVPSNPGDPKESVQHSSDQPRPERPYLDFDEEMRNAWKLIEADRPDESYAQLVNLQKRTDSPVAVWARLYWLLVAMPDLDASRCACEWLAKSLQHTHLDGPAMTLYAREHQRDAEKAVQPHCNDLVTCPAPAISRFRFLEIRWQALSYLKRPTFIVADIEQLEKQMKQQDEDVQVQFLILALQHLGWTFENKTFDLLRQELEEMGKVYGRFYDELAGIDQLMEVTKGWRNLEFERETRVPKYWRNLIPFCWTQDKEVVKREMLRVLHRIAKQPSKALEEFENIHAKSPAVLHYLGSQILDFPYEQKNLEQHGPDVDIESLFLRFLTSTKAQKASASAVVLDFCLQEMVSTWEIAQHGEAIGRILRNKLQTPPNLPLGVFHDDGPLHYVYAACQRLWAQA